MKPAFAYEAAATSQTDPKAQDGVAFSLAKHQRKLAEHGWPKNQGNAKLVRTPTTKAFMDLISVWIRIFQHSKLANSWRFLAIAVSFSINDHL